jgi:hypothetical protein
MTYIHPLSSHDSTFSPPTPTNSPPTKGSPKNQYSAAYCTVNTAGILSQVLGGLPPAVFNRYTAFNPFVVPSRYCRYSQGTLPFPNPPGPIGASTGAVELATFLATTKPYCLGGWVSRSKTGVVLFRKKWCPLRSILLGARGLEPGGTGSWRAMLGSVANRAG